MSPDTGPRSTGAVTSEFPARAPQRLRVSFEFSPPRTEGAERTLWETVTRLTPLRPTFFSVTYGAGGSTRQRTHETVARLKSETGIAAAAHLTCVAATQGEIDDVARAYWDAGIRHIVALRGDPPSGMGSKYSPHPGGYANAAALVAGLKRIGDFQISVAGYPEKHPDSPDAKADLDNLKRKLDAGATRAISQFFFDIDAFLRVHKLSDSAFGRQALNDWKLIRQLRAGRRLWPDTEGRVRTFMAGYRPKARAEAGQ